VSGASVRHKATKPCPPRGHLLVGDSQAQVFLALNGVSVDILGCAFGHPRVYDLGGPGQCSSSGCGGIGRARLAGTVAAFEEATSGGPDSGPPEYVLFVRDLRSGRVLHKVPTGASTSLNPPRVWIGPTESLLVKSDGAVAWIVQASRGEGSYQVHALDAAGGRVVASGPDIDPHSLALAAATLYWTQGGRPLSAPLN